MVNASLNWASIVGIVLAVGGALLYFMRSFKPALARDYDVFFAAIGLLCGGILFFQGWRLDPILQFGQFLLAGTTVFFAYESVRLRGVTTEQARRSSYFDDDDEPAPRPRMGGGRDFRDSQDRFDEPQPLRRRIRSRDDEYGERDEEDFYRPRRPAARAAIPERAASRDDWDSSADSPSRRYRAGSAPSSGASEFGARRQGRDDQRRGSRPSSRPDEMPRSSRRGSAPAGPSGGPGPEARNPGVPQGSPYQAKAKPAESEPGVSDAEFRPVQPSPRPSAPGPRDNSSRFDD
ncbi:Ycf66 family protein [Vulcanococcus sp.]|uniref:Ycf66 family protein n=1 Tax=Vulcanococcus sp. TaxID=2856995 RepID=UPI003232B5CF